MEKIYWVWFAGRANPRNHCARLLFEKIGDAKKIYDLSENELSGLNISDDVFKKSLSDKNLDKETEIINKCATYGYNIIPYNHEKYPERLRHISDYPYVLYHRGTHYDFKDNLAVAVVGTRKSSAYGDEVAYKLGRDLSLKNAIVVSGMAKGIDGYAHQGAMSVKKPIVVVLGSGIDVIQPFSNKKIYEYALNNGAVYTEYPPGTPGLPGHFPLRNRIISGLSVGVVVVEAEERSGSLITADYALEQGKDLFAVPNIITSPKGKGTNKLIKENAYIVTSVDDIIEEYKDMIITEPEREYDPTVDNRRFVGEYFVNGLENITPMERVILRTMLYSDQSVDSIVNTTGLPVEKVMSSLTLLEIKGAVITAPGNKYTLNFERND